MKQIKIFLERWGIHSFLLPIFFILHNYKQYYGLVSGEVAIKTLFKILIIFLIFFLLLWALTRNINKTLQLLTLMGVVFLFYGVIKDFFQLTLHAYFISRYVVLLPLVLISTIILTRRIIKKKDYRKSNLFQNALLLIFIFIDGVMLLFSDNSFFLRRNLLTKNAYTKLDRLPNPSSRPDVYYLLFDSYPGTFFLRDYMDYDNSSFNTALKEEGFHVLEDPKSNYNRTAFSMAATLNFEYLRNIRSFSPISSRDYNHARLTIEESLVPKIFKHYNYAFYNLSVFDIDGTPSIRRENFLTMPEQNVLLYNTLIERLKNDLLWNLVTGKYAIGAVQKMAERKADELASELEEKKDFNNTIIDSILKIPLQKTGLPKFVYAHFYLPHPPFFYDENGKSNDLKYVVTDESLRNKSLFLSYLKYTNKIILEITGKIIQAGGNKALIVLQSDHGFRDFEGGPGKPELFFKNYSAFYFPDKNYSALYDTMSNINTFPVLFNKYFNTKIALQKDTSVFLSY
jgi:hypothetical protein